MKIKSEVFYVKLFADKCWVKHILVAGGNHTSKFNFTEATELWINKWQVVLSIWASKICKWFCIMMVIKVLIAVVKVRGPRGLNPLLQFDPPPAIV